MTVLKCSLLASLPPGCSCVSTVTNFPPIPLMGLLSFAGSLDLQGQKFHKLVLDPPFSLSMNAICMPKTTKLVFSPDLFSFYCLLTFSFYCLTGISALTSTKHSSRSSALPQPQ